MIIIRFETAEMELQALGYLAGRFSFKTWSNGETAVPPEALEALTAAEITFIVQGPMTDGKRRVTKDISK